MSIFLLLPNKQDVDNYQTNRKSNNLDSYRDISTCGGLHSIGSDLTRMRVRSDVHQTVGSIRSEQTISKRKEGGNTPTSRAGVSASICLFDS